MSADEFRHGLASSYTNRGCRCWECREAMADEMRHQRRKHPHIAENNRRVGRARHRALTRLAEAHPEEFAALNDEERAVEGLPPVGALPRGRRRVS